MNLKSLPAGAMALALSGAALAQAAAPASLPGPAFPQFKSAAEIKAACDAGLGKAKLGLKSLQARKVDAGWLAAYDEFNALQEDVQMPVEFVLNVHPDKAVREAAQACSLRWADFSSSFGQNEKIFRALKHAPTADAIDKELQRVSLGAFEDSGVALAPAQRKRAKQILDKLSDLAQQFEKNIRDAGVKQTYTEEELKGVPEAFLKGAKRDDLGRIVLGVDYPS